MTHQPNHLTAAALVAVLVSPALGAVSLDFVPVDNSALLTGYNTFDLQMNTPDSDWVSAALLLNVSGGSIYQDPNGADQTLHPYFYTLYPTVEFDTAVGLVGGSIAGSGGDVGGDGFEFSTTELDVSFFNIDKTDIGSFPIGRITLSDDAVGTWSLLSTTADRQRISLTGSITGGVIETEVIELLSEPASVSSPSLTQIRTRTENLIPIPRSTFWFSDNPYEIDNTGRIRLYTLGEIEQLFIELGLDPANAVRSSNTFTFPGNDKLDLIGPVIVGSRITKLDPTTSTESTLPEPGTLALLGLGGLALLRRR